ncbi:MAG: hypothetical protein P1P84_11795, partial [Deferrisomatales bacterium]|nr:hypothetical protein [Deferrisomatales bacterium]
MNTVKWRSMKFFIIAFVLLAAPLSAMADQKTWETYSNIQVAAGSSSLVTFVQPASQILSGSTVTNVEVQFVYVAYNGVQSYVSARVNKGSDPGTSGGAVLVSQGSLPSSPTNGADATYGYDSFSNWNGQAANANYYIRFATALGSPYAPTIRYVRLRISYLAPQPPPAPTLQQPSNGSQTTNSTPTFSWTYSGSVDYFHAQVSTNSSFTSIVREATQVYGTTWQPLGFTPNTYYWRVRSHGTNGLWSTTWSSTYVFTITAPQPPPPTLTTPSNGATLNDPTPDLFWAQSGSASYFHVQVSRNSSFTDIAAENTNCYSFNWTPPSLSDGTYWWRVRTYYAIWSNWSSARSFNISTAPPPPPTLVAPSGDVAPGQNITFSWNPSSGAARYRLKICTDAAMANQIAGSPFEPGPGV